MPAVVGQQDEAVVNGNRCDRGIREGERLSLPPPFITKSPGSHRDLTRYVIVANLPRNASVTRSSPGRIPV